MVWKLLVYDDVETNYHHLSVEYDTEDEARKAVLAEEKEEGRYLTYIIRPDGTIYMCYRAPKREKEPKRFSLTIEEVRLVAEIAELERAINSAKIVLKMYRDYPDETDEMMIEATKEEEESIEKWSRGRDEQLRKASDEVKLAFEEMKLVYRERI